MIGTRREVTLHPHIVSLSGISHSHLAPRLRQRLQCLSQLAMPMADGDAPDDLPLDAGGWWLVLCPLCRAAVTARACKLHAHQPRAAR